MGRLTLCEASGPVTDLLQKLSGEDGEIWRRALNKMLRRENPWGWDAWRTIKLGVGPKNAADFRKALADGGFHIGSLANDILGKPDFTVATEETEIDLVIVSVADLGFKDGARRDQIYGRAIELGLELCPAEVGPQLRLQYRNQPMGEWLIVAMDPITDSGGNLRVFGVGRG